MLTPESCETHQKALFIYTPRPTVELPREATAMMRARQSAAVKSVNTLTAPGAQQRMEFIHDIIVISYCGCANCNYYSRPGGES